MVGYLTTYTGVRLDGMETMPTGFVALSPSMWAAIPVAKQQVYGLILSITFLEFFVIDLGWDNFHDKTKSWLLFPRRQTQLTHYHDRFDGDASCWFD